MNAKYPVYENDNLKQIFPDRHAARVRSNEEYRNPLIKEGIASSILRDNPYTRNMGMEKYLSQRSPEEIEYPKGSEAFRYSKGYFDMMEQGILNSTPFTNSGMIPSAKNTNYSKEEASKTSALDFVEGVSGFASKTCSRSYKCIGNN